MKWDTASSFINLGTADIVCGLLAIAFQGGVTYLAERVPEVFRFDWILADLALSSPGIWIGSLYIMTGVFGLLAGIRRRKPAVGSHPARKSYSCLTSSFAMFSVISALLSLVLIGISAALAADWLQVIYYANPTPNNDNIFIAATPITGLCFLLVIIGLIQLPATIISAYKACNTSGRVEHVVFFSGPPTVPTRTHPTLPPPIANRVNTAPIVPRVISRPASEVFTISTPASSIEYIPRHSAQSSIAGSVSQSQKLPEICYDF